MIEPIAHIMAGAKSGGAELFYERLVSAQHGNGQPILAIIRKNAERHQRLVAKGVQPIELPFRGVFDYKTRYKIKHRLHQYKPRVVISWMNRATSFTPKGPWVHVGRLGGFYNLSYYRNCHHLIGNTRGIVDWLIEQGWPKQRAHYLPNFSYPPQDLAERHCFIPPGQPFLLALGRLHVNKAFDVLIKAMRAVPSAHLLIAGEGPERARLEQLARSLGVKERVHMPGWVNDTAHLMKECDILVCPSRHEPLGNVVVEAFAAQKPVVAAASQGPRELIKNGKDGLLFPIDDAHALAVALNQMLASSSLRNDLAAAGYEKYLSHFSVAHVLAQWQHFLEHVEKT